MNLKKLQQDRADAFNAAKALHDAAAMANRPMTTEELAQYDAHTANVKHLDANIKIAKEQLEAERVAPAAGAVTVGADLAEKKPWAHAGEFLNAVKTMAKTNSRIIDPRLQAAALGGNETIDSEGGILVPTEVASDLLTKTYQVGQVTSRCDRIPMGSARLRIPRIDETSRVDGQRYGGILVYRDDEAGAYTATKSKLDALELNANKCIGLTYLTEELQEDVNAGALRKWIFDIFPQAFGFRFDNEVLNGTGAGQMLGILNSGVPVVITAQGGDTSHQPSSQDLYNMYGQLYGPSRATAAWFINQNVEPSLLNLTRGSGTAVELLYKMPGDRGNNTNYGSIFGIPVIPIEQAASLGTQGDLILADLKEYLIGDRGEMRQDSSIHVQFLTGQEAFRWMVRNDGQPKWKKPLTPYQGSQALSPFVILGAR